MRDFNGTKVIAVDNGYGNVKTANTVTPTGLVAYDTEPIFSGSILEYGGKFYRVGEGHKPFVADKATDDDNYVLTLMAIAKELNLAGICAADVHLAAGLPMTWIRRQREDFRAYLLRNESVTFRFNGKEYRVRFVGCSLFPQGYPAIINRLSEFKGTSVLADIGNGTMNVLYMQGRKPVESKCWTEKLGVDQCVTAARNAVLDNLGVKIDDGIVEQVLRNGTADIAKPYLDCIAGAARQYAGAIFDTLRRYEYNPDLMRLYVVGGGGCVLRHFGEFDRERVTFIEDICATAKGYEFLAYTALRKERAT
jgi:plasmid segregation protein ParM